MIVNYEVSSRIGEALDLGASAELRDAAMVVVQEVRHMLPLTTHCSMDVLNYLALKSDSVNFYVVPMSEGSDLDQQVKYQLERVAKAANLTMKLKKNHPTRPNEILTELEEPPWSAGSMHKSGARVSELSARASRNLQRIYAGDYAIIGMLGLYGCGGLLMCEQATQEMANIQLPI